VTQAVVVAMELVVVVVHACMLWWATALVVIVTRACVHAVAVAMELIVIIIMRLAHACMHCLQGVLQPLHLSCKKLSRESCIYAP